MGLRCWPYMAAMLLGTTELQILELMRLVPSEAPNLELTCHAASTVPGGLQVTISSSTSPKS